jgi:hypothetical protein
MDTGSGQTRLSHHMKNSVRSTVVLLNASSIKSKSYLVHNSTFIDWDTIGFRPDFVLRATVRALRDAAHQRIVHPAK